MKRTKFIMLLVVAALVLMGAGYAAWTQGLTIDSTVSTGELFVKVEETGSTYEVLDGEGNVVSDGDADEDNKDAHYLDLEVTSQSAGQEEDRETLTEITFNLTDIYPGVRQTNEITFENLGTLKTITTYDELGSIEGNELWDDLVIKVNGSEVNNGNSAQEKLKNLAEAIADAVGELETEQSKTVTIVQELPSTSENNTEDQSITWTVPLRFEQYNLQAE